MKPELTAIVVAFRMAREIPRTLATLSPFLQLDVTADSYRIEVVDNGLPEPLPDSAWKRKDVEVGLHVELDALPTPMRAIDAAAGIEGLQRNIWPLLPCRKVAS